MPPHLISWPRHCLRDKFFAMPVVGSDNNLPKNSVSKEPLLALLCTDRLTKVLIEPRGASAAFAVIDFSFGTSERQIQTFPILPFCKLLPNLLIALFVFNY